ncbi:hypothetical protein B0H10DRAFT_2438002, partial [Mycena sp. CBHHK59/15]
MRCHAHRLPVLLATPARPAYRLTAPFPLRLCRIPPPSSTRCCPLQPSPTPHRLLPTYPALLGATSLPSVPPHRALPALHRRRFPPPSSAGCCPLQPSPTSQPRAHRLPLLSALPECPVRCRTAPFPPRDTAASRRPPAPAAARC